MKHNYLCIIARLDGSDGDTHHLFEGMTKDEATEAAFMCVRNSCDRDSKGDVARDQFYVTGIVTSESPMQSHGTWGQ